MNTSYFAFCSNQPFLNTKEDMLNREHMQRYFAAGSYYLAAEMERQHIPFGTGKDALYLIKEGKLSPEEVSKITAAKDELQKALNAGTTEEIKAKMEALTNEYHVISTKLYEQAQQAQANAGQNMGGQGAYTQEQPQQETNNNNNDNVVDADFEVVDD